MQRSKSSAPNAARELSSHVQRASKPCLKALDRAINYIIMRMKEKGSAIKLPVANASGDFKSKWCRPVSNLRERSWDCSILNR
mmetsp:Transcript_22171/g.52482  ORF Transcript_22171/g.52482 Transcript_22171/m.52482 type:complete len:83 (+) Transcript_22171:263-511(+)